MVYNYTPTYYTSLHDSITSICKNILPFPFKKRRLPAIAAAEQRLSKQQSDNLKWQQESFHQILNLMGLCKEGIVQENEVSVFKTHLLETLITSPIDHEPSVILRDKLIFLQELFYAKCITEDEYHASKRPLLQRLAIQGAEIGARDVIVGAHKDISNDEWSVIDLKEEKSIMPTNKPKEGTSIKKKMGASSVFGFVSPDKNGKLKEENRSTRPRELLCSTENPFWNSRVDEKENKEKVKTAKKTWGFDGFKKWKKNETEDETAPLSLFEKSDDASYNGKKIKKTSHPNGSPSDFLADEVLGENVKKELSRIQTELSTKTTRANNLLDDRTKEISTQLPADNADLKNFFPKSWCDRHGHAVLDVVRKELNDHVSEIRNSRVIAKEEKHNSKRWTTFDDDENTHPNLFAPQDQPKSNVRTSFNRSSIDKGFKYNPFFDM